MRARLIAGFAGVAVLIRTIFSIPMTRFVATVERERMVTELERDAFILAGHAKETLSADTGSQLRSIQPYIDAYAKVSDARVVVTNSDGRVIASNDASLVVGTDFSNRPEIATALKGAPATGERDSSTLGQVLAYVAVPRAVGRRHSRRGAPVSPEVSRRQTRPEPRLRHHRGRSHIVRRGTGGGSPSRVDHLAAHRSPAPRHRQARAR